MIAEFEAISGDNLAELLTFIHGNENQVTIPEKSGKTVIVSIKEVIPVRLYGRQMYALALNILEWLPLGANPREHRVDTKYLLKVYEILGKERLTECSPEKSHIDEKCPPIPLGTKVKTTQDNGGNDVWGYRMWGVQGTVISCRHDSRGIFYYNVQHADNTVGFYLPLELEEIPQ